MCKRRFSFNLFSVEDVAEPLTKALAAEVESRGRTFKATAETKTVIGSVSRWLTDNTLNPGLALVGPTPGNGKSATARAVFNFLCSFPKQMETRYIRESREIQREFHSKMDSIQPMWNTRWSADERQAWVTDHPAEYGEIEALTNEMEQAYITNAGKEKYEQVSRIESPSRFYSAQGIATAALTDWPDTLRDICSNEFVFVDDIGVESQKVYSKTEVLPIPEVIYRAYDYQLALIFTSNLAPQDIAKRYGDRVLDRLREMCEFIAFRGKSFR